MVFARRQFAALVERGYPATAFYLQSRTSVRVVWKERIRFARELRERRPDIVHAQFGTMTAFFAVISSARPLVVTYRGSDLNPVPSISRLRRWFGLLFSQIAALRARAIICVSRELVGRLWWRGSIAEVIPSGIDTKTFRPSDRNEARDRLGWSHEEEVILFNASRLPRVKRLDLAQAAFDIVRLDRPNARLHLLDGSTPPQDLPLIMNASDCLLMTSDYEGSPNIVKEALACNLPVVSVDVGDVRERIEGVMNSFITGRRPDEIAGAVSRVLASRSRSNGVTRISSISLDVTTNALIRIYRTIGQRG